MYYVNTEFYAPIMCIFLMKWLPQIILISVVESCSLFHFNIFCLDGHNLEVNVHTINELVQKKNAFVYTHLVRHLLSTQNI